MKTNDTFDLTRVGRLLTQNFVNNYKLITLTLIGFSGGLTIILLFMQMVEEFKPLKQEAVSILFYILFFGLGVLYTGSAFPDFRRKEKSFGYLLKPASVFEKFLVEFVSRVLLYVLLMPILFLLVYNIEGLLLQAVYPVYEFKTYSILSMPEDMVNEMPRTVAGFWSVMFGIAMMTFFFAIPFTGGAVFTKYPLVKTLFSVALLFFTYIGLAFLAVKGFNVESYRLPEGESWILPTSPGEAIKFGTIAYWVGNFLLLGTAYFKIKEKEV